MKLKDIFKERLNDLLDEFRASGKTEIMICRELEVSCSKFGNWKHGRNFPEIENLYALAKYFDVSIDYLVGLKDDYK